MPYSRIAGMGHYVPDRVVTNDDLAQVMDTSDEWIRERTGIEQRRYATKSEETTATMGAEAARRACAAAGIEPADIDFIIFATLSPDYYFPGCGVLVQRELGITDSGCGALDVRNQCSGFIYALTVADQFVSAGMYRNVLVIGSEMHSMGLDFSTQGRGVTVIFGDGAGAAVVQPSTSPDSAVLSGALHADGTYAEKLAMLSPGSHGGKHLQQQGDTREWGFAPQDQFGGIFATQTMLDQGEFYPVMEGQFVFKLAVQKFPEVIQEVLAKAELTVDDIDMLIPHQANLRIAQFVQRSLKLSDDQVYNNIQRYGNTTAASVPIALSEAVAEGKVKRGDIVVLAAFGSGFTWGANVIRW